MDDKKRSTLYRLIFIAIILLMALAFFLIRIGRLYIPLDSYAKLLGGSRIAPTGEADRSYAIPPGMTVNPFPGDEEIKKKIAEDADRKKILKEKVAGRDNRAAVVREKVVAIQDRLLADEVKNAPQVAAASKKAASSTVTYAKKESSSETKPKILPSGHYYGH